MPSATCKGVLPRSSGFCAASISCRGATVSGSWETSSIEARAPSRSCGGRSRWGTVIVVVLGNHDLHLLARAEGLREARKRDTFDDVLEAPDRDALIEWLAGRPLFHREGDFVMVHAGLLPDWSLEEAEALAWEAQEALRSRRRYPLLESFEDRRRVAAMELRAFGSGAAAAGRRRLHPNPHGEGQRVSLSRFRRSSAAGARRLPAVVRPVLASRRQRRCSSDIGRRWGCTSAETRSASIRGASGDGA